MKELGRDEVLAKSEKIHFTNPGAIIVSRDYLSFMLAGEKPQGIYVVNPVVRKTIETMILIPYLKKFIEDKMPHKALKPTPVDVTDRAKARSAPATYAADLIR
jgi:hypothetical protein